MDVLRKIAFPISLLYACGVYSRNFLYDVGVFKSESFPTPTLCVGNLSVGGTGKTPMVEFLISNLKNEGSIAVLSRGYKRKSKGFLLAEENSTVEDLGDEPFQIFSKFPNIILAVDSDRCNGIGRLENETEPKIIILDDAFQHRKVTPTTSILLTAYGDLYTKDWYLPSGSLRDSRIEAKRADFIVVTKCPSDLSYEKQKAIVKELKPTVNQQVLFAFFQYAEVLKGLNADISLEVLKNKSVTLVTGIAKPKPLVDFLNSKKISFNHLAYNDHHFFTDNELKLFNSKELILTTEKDYVRLKGKVKNLYYISVKHQFLDNGDTVLLKEIRNLILS